MDDLTAFVKARLDDDEELAQAASRYGGTWAEDARQYGYVVFYPDESEPFEYGVDWPERAAHIARHDPARVLREVAAKRAMLERHGPHQTAFAGLACNWCSEDVDDRPQLAKERWPCPDVRDLAAVWSDHPDYRQEWAP